MTSRVLGHSDNTNQNVYEIAPPVRLPFPRRAARYHAPVPRRLFTLCSAVSLLPLLAACAVWVRSYFVADWVGRFAADGGGSGLASEWVVLTAPGRAHVTRRAYTFARPVAPPAGATAWETHRAADVLQDWFDRSSLPGRIGFGWGASRKVSSGGNVIRQRAVTFPLWLPAALAAVLPAAWVRRRLVPWRRARAGLCAVCGYDLRASPGRCPECGEAIVVKVIPERV